MSKSLGNVVDPFDLLNKMNLNSIRTYFIAEGPYRYDANFNYSALIDHHNKFFCDRFLNLLQRINGDAILRDRTEFKLD